MNFTRRLTLFIFGILLGSAFVYAVLIRGREMPAWLPGDRVLEELRLHPVQVSAKGACQLKCNNLENNDILNLLNTAEVLFSESDVRDKDIPEYVLEGKGLKGQTLKMKFKSQQTTTNFLELIQPATADTCNCK